LSLPGDGCSLASSGRHPQNERYGKVNAATTMAWLICLVLAFFAAALALTNRYQLVSVEARLRTVEAARSSVPAAVKAPLEKPAPHATEGSTSVEP